MIAKHALPGLATQEGGEGLAPARASGSRGFQKSLVDSASETQSGVVERRRVQSREKSRWYRARHKERIRERVNEQQRQRRARNREHHRAWDREYYRERRSWRRIEQIYGLTRDDFSRMLQVQRGRCLICEEPLRSGKHTHVDHDHTTQQVRGLLCGGCNRSFGTLKEDPTIIQRMLEYAEFWKGW